jgi:hypothetical protein
MQKPQIVAHLLGSADQDATETIYPTLGALYHPAPRLVPGFLLQRFGFLASCPDVGGEPEPSQQVVDLVTVIAFVQTPPLGSVCGRLRLRHWDALDRLPSHLEIMASGPLHRQANRRAAVVVGENCSLQNTINTAYWDML